MRQLKHLPVDQWSNADHEAFRTIYEAGDVFDETGGPGAHLAEGTRKLIRTAYRRWLGFLKAWHPADLLKPPADRITPERVRAFVIYLSAEIKTTSVAIAVDNLHYVARLIAPAGDWRWLHNLKARLAAQSRPEDRFGRLVPPWQTLDFGIELMDEALGLPTTRKQREIQYRDGLLIALLSLWPIRRRSIAALTISGHVEFNEAGITILLRADDTKAKRAESFQVPEPLLPYLRRYFREIRPKLLGRGNHDGFWASYKKGPLSDGSIYTTVRARVFAKFGKKMGLHDFRRAAATYLAIDAPEKIRLVPGVLQHASPEDSERYNLARSIEAGRRFGAYVARTKKRLQPISTKSESDPCAP